MARLAATLTVIAALLCFSTGAAACPFCVAEMQTLSEEISGADVAVIAQLDDDKTAQVVNPETGEALMAIRAVLKGDELLAGAEKFQAIYFGAVAFDKQFLVRGFGDPIEWAIPIELSPLAVEYVQQLQTLPEAGADRLAFFQDYLEHEDRQLAQDAYDEFARAPYADLIDLKDRMDHDRVVELINQPGISPSRRRLFFVMLSVCGTSDDLPMLEALIESDVQKLLPAARAATTISLAAGGPLATMLTGEQVQSEERRRKAGLNAMIACYLSIRGEAGLDLIDRRFLAGDDVDQTYIYPTLMALRFLADEGAQTQGAKVVPRQRVLASARLLLDKTAYADQIIVDLTRWEDWSIIDRLGQMYRDAGDGNVSKYVRDPIVTYLDIAAEQQGAVGETAEALIAELEERDPETFRRARSLSAFGYLGRARQLPRADDAASTEFSPRETASGDELQPPDPAAFAAADAAADAAGPAPASPPVEQPAGVAEPPAVAGTLKANIPAGAEPLTPPSSMLLLGVPLLAVAGCFGLFWAILRGGG